MKFQVSLAQMDVKLGMPAENFETLQHMAEEAKHVGSDIVLFPELWSTGYDLANASRHASGLNQGLLVEVSSLARRLGMFIIGSTLVSTPSKKISNTLTVFAPDGNILAHYSKIHLFRLMDEDQYLTAGNEIQMVDLPFGKAGLAVCYDLRFPELFRSQSLAGAEMIFLPSEWPHPRLSHWQTLVKARAIENQVFVFACNRVGSDSDNDFFGHSMIVNPWGDVLVEGSGRVELLTQVIDMDMVVEARRKIPIFRDRRPDVY